MSQQPSRMPLELSEREHSWLTALLILATIAAGFVVVAYVTALLALFGDVIMIFFLAWLLAFILSPLAALIARLVPRLPQTAAVLLVYALLVVLLIFLAVQIAAGLVSSIQALISAAPTLQRDLPRILQPLQERLDGLGLGQVRLDQQGQVILDNLKSGAQQLIKPLSDIALASIGMLGNLLFVFVLSMYMAVDRDRITSFLFRLVPPSYTDEAKLLETSISRSFGGFLRGQALQGLIYACVAAGTSFFLGLDYLPLTTAAAGILQAIPFFGPFISWAPPVLIAVFFKPEAVLPSLVIMFVGWFILMNILQPRLMADSVGLHPIVVLGSVLIGTKLAGVAGAVFGIPIAAVISAFFFYYLGRHRMDGGPVAVRAARRVEQREGRPIRVPRLPQAGEDEEVEGVAEAAEPRPQRRRGRPSPGTAGADPAGPSSPPGGQEQPLPGQS